MFGAYCPPWITKKDFHSTPFNYCDRWCEKCAWTKICRVFLDCEKSRIKHIKEGRDPDSWECIFEDIHESFIKTYKLIQKSAQRLGIDLNKIKETTDKDSPPAKSFPLYNLINNYSDKLKKIIDELSTVPIDTNKDLVLNNLEIISFYRIILLPKTYRALTSKITEKEEKEKDYFDSKNTAFIIIRSLINTSDALSQLIKHRPLNYLRYKLKILIKTSLDLIRIIDEEFMVNIF